jgi:S1-C subfamily serine protease
MDGDWFSFGDVPDDADGPGDDDTFHKGWIHPDDRLWRHPSEFARTGGAPALEGAGRDRWRERRVAIAAGTFGAAAVAAAAAVVLALANPPVDRVAAGGVRASDTSLVTVPSNVASRANSVLSRSLVELQAAGSGHVPLTGVVLPGGHLIVTTAFAAAGAKRMQVTTSGGRHIEGTVVATDESSGVTVVATDERLSSAPFADELVSPGELALVACLQGRASASSPSAYVTVAVVQQVGRQVKEGDGQSLMDAIEAHTQMHAMGGVLLDSAGEVIGILNRQVDVPSGTMGLFVPAALALDVANELATSHHIDHGWIGVADSNAPGDSGAEIDGVLSGSPAATSGLQPGDVVTAVNGHKVLTYADLQARLYTIPPGETVQLTVDRNGSLDTLSVVPATSTP